MVGSDYYAHIAQTASLPTLPASIQGLHIFIVRIDIIIIVVIVVITVASIH